MDLDNKQAAHIANFVEFAYNMFDVGGLTPPPDPGIAAAGYELLYYIDAFDFDTKVFYGYVASSVANPGDIIIAIRGTRHPAEWVLDFLAIPVPFTAFPSAGFVALGFQSIFDTFEFIDRNGASITLSSAIAAIAAATPIKQVTVIGHSLGSALATLTAADIALNNLSGARNGLQIYTFASPRVGLLDFAAAFNAAVPTSFRVWNTLDIVPEVPPFPYIHVSGLSDAIVQNEQQLSTLVFSPVCEHVLTSYLWLLDAADFPLPADCSQATHPALLAHAAHAGVAPAAVVPNSARVLRKAMAGRL